MIDKRLSTPLYMQIQNMLLEQIRAGEYEPGEQIPSELEISAQYSVSRMTARKALDMLVSKGLLYRSKGKGTYVAENVVSYGLSTMLSFSHTLRAKGYSVETQVLRTEVIPGSIDIQDKLQLKRDSRVIVIERLRLVEGQPATIHTSFLEHRLFSAILDVDLSQESLLDTMQRISRLAIAYTQDSVQADLALPGEASLLQIQPSSPVLRVEGIAYAENGQPTRLTRAVYNAQMFKFVVKNTAEFAAALQLADPLAAFNSDEQ